MNREVKTVGVLFLIALLSGMVLCSIQGCKFSLLGDAPSVPEAKLSTTSSPAAIAHSEGELGPFPWEWCIGIAFVGTIFVIWAAIKIPTLVDEVLLATGGGMGVICVLQMAREVWHAKYILLFTLAFIMLCLGLWKLCRKYLLS